MFLYLTLVSLLLHHNVRSGGENHLSDQDHHPRGNHNPEFDHESFLGKDTARVFDELPPDKSKEKLGNLFHKVDEQILADGLVTEEELKKWIQRRKRLYNCKDIDKEMKKYDTDRDGTVAWNEYKEITYPSLDEIESEYEKLVHDMKQFKMADKMGDMKLDTHEFCAFLHPEDYKHMIDYTVKETLDDIDKDKDGSISLGEYVGDYEGQDDLLKIDQDHFAEMLDKNKDGKLNEEEIKAWLFMIIHDYSVSEAKHLIAESDSNADGKISKEEMMEKYYIFAGSQVTDFGEVFNSREEL